MNLGEWVEFDTIVVKKVAATGSTPASFPLGRARQGVVIGERAVYDVEFGAPPALSNRRQVLLVAVSLHRTYRVLHADARPSAPPPPRPRSAARSSQPAPAVALNLTPAGSMLNGRANISQNDLELLVADQINQQLAADAIFTAYDLTAALRDANPQIDLPHAAVREAIHAQMAAIVASGLYDREQAMFGSDSAWRYVPV